MRGDWNDRNMKGERNQLIGSQGWRFRILPLLVSLLITSVSAQDVEQYFQQNCSICHTIGGGRTVGPDLKGVSDRVDREWLVDFIVDSQAVIDSGDPYALELLKEAGGVVMPPAPGMTPERAHDLLDFIEEQSAKEAPAGTEPKAEERPLTLEDVERGRALFLGLTRMENGGAACIGCHTINGDSSLLGGGMLGPNLTAVLPRLGRRQGLSGWLSSPPTPTMRAVFQEAPLTSDEIHSFVALFQHQAETNPPARAAPFVNFLLFGVGGTAVLLVLFDLLWRRRFRAVRQPLVQKVRRRIHSRIELEDERTLYD